MDLNLSDEQRLLRESVDRFIAETYDADHRRRGAGDPLGFSPAIWRQFAELGSGMVAGGRLGSIDWGLLAAIPLIGIVQAMLTARITVLAALRRML